MLTKPSITPPRPVVIFTPGICTLALWALPSSAVAKTCLVKPPSYPVYCSLHEAFASFKATNVVPCTAIDLIYTLLMISAGCQSWICTTM
jgi:hypothetical protein